MEYLLLYSLRVNINILAYLEAYLNHRQILDNFLGCFCYPSSLDKLPKFGYKMF
jgi:hypothetical protein